MTYQDSLSSILKSITCMHKQRSNLKSRLNCTDCTDVTHTAHTISHHKQSNHTSENIPFGPTFTPVLQLQFVHITCLAHVSTIIRSVFIILYIHCIQTLSSQFVYTIWLYNNIKFATEGFITLLLCPTNEDILATHTHP